MIACFRWLELRWARLVDAGFYIAIEVQGLKTNRTGVRIAIALDLVGIDARKINARLGAVASLSSEFLVEVHQS